METFLLTTIMRNSLKNIYAIKQCDNDSNKCKQETMKFLQEKLEEAIKWGKKRVVEEVLGIIFSLDLLRNNNFLADQAQVHKFDYDDIIRLMSFSLEWALLHDRYNSLPLCARKTNISKTKNLLFACR